VLNAIPLASPSLCLAAVTFPALLNTVDQQLADQQLRPIGKELLAYICSACSSFKPGYATFRLPFGKGPQAMWSLAGATKCLEEVGPDTEKWQEGRTEEQQSPQHAASLRSSFSWEVLWLFPLHTDLGICQAENKCA